jgi:hypothetical protein
MILSSLFGVVDWFVECSRNDLATCCDSSRHHDCLVLARGLYITVVRRDYRQ